MGPAMSEKQKKGFSGVEMVGLVVCIGGALVAAVVTLSIFRGEVEGNPGPSALLARDVISFLGITPALLVSVCCAVLGARSFLSGRSGSFTTNVSGVVGTSIGLAVLLGAFSPTAGGVVGAYSGGLLASYLTTVPAAIFGLVVLAIPIWLTWLRDFRFLFRERGKSGQSPAALIEEPIVGGVSPEEEAALLPRAKSAERKKEQVLEDARDPYRRPTWALQNTTSTPYPEDVRLRGKIPAGAVPLTTSDDETQISPSVSDSTVHRWTPGGAKSTGEPADGDLADGGEQEAEQRPEASAGQPTRPGGSPRSGGSSGLKAAESGAPTAELEANPDLTRVLLGGARHSTVETEAETSEKSGLKVIRPEFTPPAPLWEQGEVGEGDEDSLEGEEETLDEELLEREPFEVESESAPPVERASASPAADLLEAVTPDRERSGADEADDAGAPTLEARLVEEEDEEELEDLVDEGDFEEAVDLDGHEDEEDEDDEEEIDGDEDFEYELAEEDEDSTDLAVNARSGDEDDEDDEDEEDDEDDEDDELGEDEEWEYEYVEVDEDELGDGEWEEVDEDEEKLLGIPRAGAASEEGEETPAVEEAPGAPEPAPLVATEEIAPSPDEASPVELTPVAARGKSSGEVQMDLFADPRGEAEPAEEPVVVIQPSPAPTVRASERARIVAELILDEERVAVSMVQRRFGIDFAESCAILDELQQVGFIGPYVDGRSRDILMSREEWLAAVTPG